jgi:hypothetical protein
MQKRRERERERERERASVRKTKIDACCKAVDTTTMPLIDYIYAATPLMCPSVLLGNLLWRSSHDNESTNNDVFAPQLLAYTVLSASAFVMTNSLVPHIKVRE